MSDDVLELALALHQAPIQRFALRDRPLPDSIGTALQLAAAAQPQLGDAAAMCSESEEVVLEAVRFYLHQVLFEPGTDAYRILGLSADADSNQIRQHHVWLQRWLHPDRRGEDWEAVFATKVNWAWAQLRSEASRAEYDRNRQLEMTDEPPDPAVTAVQPVPAWSVAPSAAIAPRRRLRRVGIGLMFAGCLVLFYLAATQEDHVDPGGFTQITTDPGMSPASASLPAEHGDMRTGDVNSAQSAATVVAPFMAPRPDPTSVESVESAPRVASEHEVNSGIREESGAESKGPELVAEADAIRVAPTRALDIPAEAATPIARMRSGSPAPAGQPLRASQSGPESAIATVADSGSGEQNPGAMTAAQAEPVSIGTNPDESGNAASLDMPAAGSGTSSLGSPSTGLETLSRFELAREQLRNIVHFFGTSGEPSPAWDDDEGQRNAEHERRALRTRHSEAAIDRFSLDAPQWSVSDTSAALRADYRVVTSRTAGESGQFALDMAWRDGAWKITRIRVSPSS